MFEEQTTASCPVDGMVIHPVFVSLDQEIIRRAIECCETAIENTAECLAIHDATNGRTTRKNKWIAQRHEQELVDAKRTRNELRAALGWPEVG